MTTITQGFLNREVVNMLNTIADRPELRRLFWGYLFYLMLKALPDLIDAISPMITR